MPDLEEVDYVEIAADDDLTAHIAQLEGAEEPKHVSGIKHVVERAAKEQAQSKSPDSILAPSILSYHFPFLRFIFHYIQSFYI